MFKLTLATLVILALGASAFQDTPIPPRPDGFSLGSNSPKLHLEVFFDLLCPDSRTSWRILEPILRNDFHITTNQTLRFTIHMFPLPYHFNAFFTAQGARIIYDNLKNPEDIFTYINLIFDNLEKFTTPGTVAESPAQVAQRMKTLINAKLPAYSEFINAGFLHGDRQFGEGKVSWKYACYKGVTGAPVYLANGVAVVGAGEWNGNEWKNFLNGSYLKQKLSPSM